MTLSGAGEVAAGRDTVLGGSLPDQAALHGVLGQIEALGVELLEVRRTPDAHGDYLDESPVIVMELTRQHVVDILRRTGFLEAADEAMRVLPDPVDLEHVVQWGAQYGISRDELISRMGGSP